jgi:hypothetical protein
MPITPWPHYADHPLALICRSRPGSNTPVGDLHVDAVRYNGTIHDLVLLNALRDLPSIKATIDQINDGVRRHLANAVN